MQYLDSTSKATLFPPTMGHSFQFFESFGSIPNTERKSMTSSSGAGTAAAMTPVHMNKKRQMLVEADPTKGIKVDVSTIATPFRLEIQEAIERLKSEGIGVFF